MAASTFVEWAKTAASIDTSLVQIVESATEGYGLVAASEIEAEQTVFTIPLAEVLRVDLANAGDVHAQLLAMLEPTHALAVAAWLASVEEPTASHIAPWLNMWPKDPVGGWGFTDDEWAELRKWCVEADVLHNAQEAAARRVYDERIVPHFEAHRAGLPPLTWERFVYFHSMVLSRAADVKASQSMTRGGLAIIPLLDLLNHRVTPSAYLSFEPDACDGLGGFVVKAYAALSAGDPLFINYGDKENAQLLVSYGFALARNPSDTATIKLAVDSDHPLNGDSPFAAMLPHGVRPMFESAARDHRLMGAVCWQWDDSMYEERPVNVDDQLVLRPDVAETAVMLAALAAVSSPEGLLGAIGQCSSLATTPPHVFDALAAACAETLAALPEPLPADAAKPAAVALAARRELLSAVVQARGRPYLLRQHPPDEEEPALS